MGFTTGFLGGFTLTASVLYLSISLHTRNRMTQAALLRQQQTVLKNVVEPEPPGPEPAPRVVPAGLAEMAKDKWNRALETSLKSVYETDWRRVREDAEDKVGNIVEKIRKQE